MRMSSSRLQQDIYLSHIYLEGKHTLPTTVSQLDTCSVLITLFLLAWALGAPYSMPYSHKLHMRDRITQVEEGRRRGRGRVSGGDGTLL